MKNNYKLNQWHFFKIRDKYFIFVSENLRLYVVDKDSYNELKKVYEKYGNKELFEYDAETNDSIINELIEEELAIRITNEKEEKKDKNDEKNEGKLIISSLTLEIANDCNLNCLYCYGSGGSYGKKRELMDFATAKKGIDYMVENSGDLEELHLTFFGGEPLINFKVIKQIDKYCKELELKCNKKFRYSITTNGTILNEEIYNFIKDNDVSTMISMDGNKKIQNCYRCYESGKGSYDDVVKNIDKFKEAKNGHLSVRSTVCKPNLNLKEIKDDLLNLGFTKVNMTLVDVDKNSPLYVGNESKDIVLKNYLELAEDYKDCISKGKPFYNHYFDSILENIYNKKILIQSCNAGTYGFSLATDGYFYPCHRFMGMHDYSVGNINDGIDISLTNEYRKANVLSKADCKDCWARFLCGGSCVNTCVTQENDIMKAPNCYCEIYKGIYEIILYLYFLLKSENNEYFKTRFNQNKIVS